jgi:ubiquitin C-terminal hydrolase
MMHLPPIPSISFYHCRPKALILHLKRFIVVERPKITVEQKEGENLSPNAPTKPVVMEYVFQKKKTPVAIPATLTLDPFRMLVKDAGEHSTQEYSLNSVVHHIGSHASSGHYTADAVRLIPSDSAAKTIDTDSGEIASEQQLQETWIRFDDGQTTITDLEEVIKPVTKQQSAYMLLYTLNINDT